MLGKKVRITEYSTTNGRMKGCKHGKITEVYERHFIVKTKCGYNIGFTLSDLLDPKESQIEEKINNKYRRLDIGEIRDLRRL